MESFTPGQRWFSSAEPELGLGTVLRTAGRSVQIVFTGSGELRNYAIASAPLLRATFRPGERVRVDGIELVVRQTEPHDGLMRYRCEPTGAGASRTLDEGELDADQPVSQADSRMLAGRVDRSDVFEFRVECLQRRMEARAHPGWGVLGARIDLIPHQLRVAQIAARRRPPRLLLADEVGLGKTIEAGLIIAQQLACGRARRVLVLVPESLVNQWFVELLRRFNLPFAIYDEERCESLTTDANPFEDEQCVIASAQWLASDDARARQLLDARWDLLLVDEAHHLTWSPEAASSGYRLVEALAAQTPGLLLLTATPEQLGLGGHFARLRLLDPSRYSDLAAFEAEARGWVELSPLGERLHAGASLTTGDLETLATLLPDAADTLAHSLDGLTRPDSPERNRLLDALIDRHGTGRVMVRNRRAAVGGFPVRIAHVDSIDVDDDPAYRSRLLAEFLHDAGEHHNEPEHDYTHDPRLDWLLALLERIAPDKALLLCRSRAKVQAIEEALRVRAGLQVARFHEQMSLLQRDRNAAYFADPAGARLLVASEVGAEGRNFQFAQHLILWDLPLHPDMLEQRIGRLDRIGQRGDVHIHAQAIAGSAQEVLLRWYDDGLDAFRGVLADGSELLHRFREPLLAIAGHHQPSGDHAQAMARLIEQTRSVHTELTERIARGRDRLLELGGQRGAADGELLRALQGSDLDARHDDFPLRLLEHFGIHNEPLADRVWLLDPEYMTVDGFDEMRSGPRQATFDRELALARDDLLYLRFDHPLLLSAADLLVSGERGNAAFLVDDALPPRTVILEAVYVLECVAASGLQIERFLPPSPLRVAVDTRLQARAAFAPSARALQRAGEREFDLSSHRKLLAALIPPMVERTAEEAAAQAGARIAEASAAAEQRLGDELARLQALARVNPAVKPDEIAALDAERAALATALAAARPRLDALRLVASPDFLSIKR